MTDSGKRTNRVIICILIDIILFGVCILSFCYFHHVRKMLGIGGNNGNVPTTAVISKPSPSPVSATPSPSETPVPTGSELNTPVPTQTSTPTPTPECDENGTPYDFSGDFGAKFGKLFSADNQIVSDETSYRSHDVYVKMTAFNGNYAQRDSRTSEHFTEDHTVWYAFDIYVRNIENLFTNYSNSGTKQFSVLYNDTTFGKAVAAVSGDLFLYYEESKSVIVRNGAVIRTADYIAEDICVLYWDGTMEIETHDTYDWNRIKERAPYQIWSFGPSLIAADGSINRCTESPVWIKNPRAAVGMVEPGHYVLLGINGYRADEQRAVNGGGATLEATAQIMHDMGCKVAYNLDGGASVYAGFLDSDLIRVTNVNGTIRSISDIICVGERPGQGGAE